MALWPRPLVHRGELKKRFFNGAIVINMYSVLEHIVHKILIGPHKVIEHREHLQVLPLALVEGAEGHVVGVDLHLGQVRGELLPVLDDLLVPLLHLLLLFLQRLQLALDLVLHHLVEVLLLDFQLLDDPPEGLFEPFHFLSKLLFYL
jgi:hypothetical protein